MDALHTQEWIPVVDVRACMLIVHGYAEHGGRYAALAQRLTDEGIHVFTYDQKGHGGSGGKRGYIPSFEALVTDLAGQLVRVVKQADGRPVFLLGHSMGGLVAANFLATRPNDLAGAVISSPLLVIPKVPAWKLRASGWLSRMLPWLPVERIDPTTIARDADVVAAYQSDPLVYHGPIAARTGAELLKGIRATAQVLPRIQLPLLVLHGTADQLAPFAGGERLHKEAGSASRSHYWEEGGFHELLNDQGREAAFAAILDWLEKQLAGRT